MRRDKDDIDWQNCKAKVYSMDNSQCLLCQCMTVTEKLLFLKSNPENTSKIDPAHYQAVSKRQDLMYDPDNVFCLCRPHHNRIDNNRNPITNEQCSAAVTESFWQRIIAKRKKNSSTTSTTTLPEFFCDL